VKTDGAKACTSCLGFLSPRMRRLYLTSQRTSGRGDNNDLPDIRCMI